MNSPRRWSLATHKPLKPVKPLTKQPESVMNRAELCGQGREGRATARLGAEGCRRVADERPAPLLSEDQPLVTELAVRALNSHELHAKFLGKRASCWEPVPRVVLTIGARDLLAELRRNLLGRRRGLGHFGALIHAPESNRT